MPPCLTLSIIRYRSRVKSSNPGKGVAPSPTPRYSSYRKGAFGSPSTTVANFLHFLSCDFFFLRGLVKGLVNVPPFPTSLEQLEPRIPAVLETLTQNMLQRVWDELNERLDVCRVTTSAQIENLLNRSWNSHTFQFLIHISMNKFSFVQHLNEFFVSLPRLWRYSDIYISNDSGYLSKN